MSITYCPECFEKQRRIDKLEEECERLRGGLAYQERVATEGYFGSSTPSSQRPLKVNSLEENRMKKGGAKLGHKGHGRRAVKEERADRVEEVSVGCECPDCGVVLKDRRVRRRTVITCSVVKVE